MTYKNIEISKIQIPENRARNLDAAWAEALAAMFKDHGNKTAIEVRTHDSGSGYILVSGLHRLEAAKLCEWSELTAKIIEATSEKGAAEYKLHEVMENIGRRELTILDRAHHLSDFKSSMEALHPELKKGGNSSVEASEEDRTAILALRNEIAEKVGLSDRSIQRAVALWGALSPETRERVSGTWLADHQAGLIALSDKKPREQKKILDILFDPENDAKSVSDAVEFIEQGRLASSAEKRIGSLTKTFQSLDDTTFDQLMDLNADRVKAWLARQG